MSVCLSPGSFYGQAVRRQATPRLTLTENVYASGSVAPMHWHERPYFCFVVAGEFEETSNGKARRYAPSEVIFHPAGDPHADRFGKTGGRCFSVEMDPGWLDWAPERGAATIASAVTARGELSWILTRIYGEFRNADKYSPLATEGLTALLVAELYRASERTDGPKPPKWLQSVRARLREEFSDSLTLAELAAGAEVHQVHLAREFQRFYRSSVGEFVRRLRVEAACDALASTDDPIGQIGLEIGFADQAHFSRTFKAMTGMTPGAYRSALRSAR